MTHQVTDEMVYQLRQLQKLIYTSNVEAGWYTDLETGEYKARDFGLAVTEIQLDISKAFEGWRDNLPDEHLQEHWSAEVHMAAAIMGILDLAESRGMDLAGALRAELAYNQVLDGGRGYDDYS